MNKEDKKEDLKFMNSKQRKEVRKEGRDLEFSNLEERKKRSRILNLKQRKEEISNLVI